jgi:hypothetical protein
MPKFNLDDYVQVNDRIVKFWDKYENGAVLTELVYVDDRCVRMKAIVYADRNDPLALATGHAEEYRITEADIAKDKRKQYEPNATSAVENCETSAVGRAMANAGFEVSKSVASRQEMEKVARQQIKRENSQTGVDKPKEPAKVSTNGAGESDKLTPDEARILAGRIKSTGIEMSAVRLKLVAMGTEEKKTLSETLQTMNKDEAQELFTWVTGETSNEGQTTTA